MFAEGYAPREVEFVIVEQHPTLLNVTLQASKVSFAPLILIYNPLLVLANNLTQNLEPGIYVIHSQYIVAPVATVATVAPTSATTPRTQRRLVNDKLHLPTE